MTETPKCPYCGAELMLELVEKHGLDVVRKAHENLKAQEENPPE